MFSDDWIESLVLFYGRSTKLANSINLQELALLKILETPVESISKAQRSVLLDQLIETVPSSYGRAVLVLSAISMLARNSSPSAKLVRYPSIVSARPNICRVPNRST